MGKKKRTHPRCTRLIIPSLHRQTPKNELLHFVNDVNEQTNSN
jgi:hypothetical protein